STVPGPASLPSSSITSRNRRGQAPGNGYFFSSLCDPLVPCFRGSSEKAGRCATARTLSAGGKVFAQLFVSAGVDHLRVAHLKQQVLSGGRAAAAAAVECDGRVFGGRDQGDTLRQVSGFDAYGAGQRSLSVLWRGADIDQNGAGVLQRGKCRRPVDLTCRSGGGDGHEHCEQFIHGASSQLV